MALPALPALVQAGLVPQQVMPPTTMPAPPQPPQGGGLDAAKMLQQEYERMSGELPGARAMADKALADQMEGLANYQPDRSGAWLKFAGAVTKPTRFGSLGEVISNIGEDVGPEISAGNTLKDKYRQLALQLGYQAQEKNADQLQSGKLALLKDMATYQRGQMGRSTVKMDKDGNLVVYDPISNSARVVHSSQIGEYDRLYQKFLEVGRQKGTFTDLEDLKAWASSSAANQLASARSVTPTTTIQTPGAAPVASGPLQPAPGAAAAPPPAVTPSPLPPGAGVATGFPGQPKYPDQDAEASRIADQLAILEKEKKDYADRGNFAAATDVQKQITGLRSKMPGTRILTTEEKSAAGARGSETGKLEVKRAFAQPTEMTALKEFIDSTKPTLETALKLPEHPGLQSASGTEGMIPFRGNVLTAGGTPSANFKAQISKLADQIAFQKLAAMRAASENGASGLGQVTEKEHDMLRHQIASLDLSQDPRALQEEINQISDRLIQMRQRIVEAYSSKYPTSVRTVRNQVYVQGKDGLWNPL